MVLEVFSAGYWLAPGLEVTTYGGNRAIIQDDVFWELVAESGYDPLIGCAGGSHFELHPDQQVPADYVAVPNSEDFHARDGDSLLIARRGHQGSFLL